MSSTDEQVVASRNDLEPEPVEYADRYSVRGMPWPDPKTVCAGPCEGVGVYPEDDPKVIRAAGAVPDEDGWAFLTCPDCAGSGKRKS